MNKQHKLIILAAVAGFSAVGLLILLRRRHRDENKFDDNGVQESQDLQDFADLTASDAIASASETVVTLNVPQYCVGAIIGKGGENIRQLKKETGVRIDFEREIKEQDSKKPFRVLELRGEREKVQNAEIRISTFISEVPKVIETEILVPQGACGQIIGKRGDNIRELSNISGAKISIESYDDRSLNGMRRALLRGTPQQVDYAKALIQEKVELSRIFQNQRAAKRRAKKRSPSPASRRDIPASKLPATDGFFRVFVSAFDIPNHFYIQCITQDSRKLDELSAEMTSYYGNPELFQDKKPPGKVIPGDVYCAPFEFDDLWYRGSVIETNEEEQTAVLYYIDYGDTGTVPFDELRRPKPEFLQLEAQAIECFLADVLPKDGQWTEESIDRFEELSHCAKWSEVMARVVGFQEIAGERFPCLELVDTNSEMEINIARTLIKEGHAVDTSSSAASSESQLQVINEDSITGTPNNNVLSMVPPSALPSQSTESGAGLAKFVEVGDVQNRGENEIVVAGNDSEVIEKQFVTETFSASDGIFDENEAVFAEAEKSPKDVSLSQISSEMSLELDGQFQVANSLNHSNRSSVEIASISSSSTEDTVIHVSGKARIEAKSKDVDPFVKGNLQEIQNKDSVKVDDIKLTDSAISPSAKSHSDASAGAQIQVSEERLSEAKSANFWESAREDSVDSKLKVAENEVIGHASAGDANDSGVDLETVNFDPNSKRSINEEVTRWMERSYEETTTLETILEGAALDNSERAFVHSLMSSGSQSAESDIVSEEVSGSPKTFRLQESLELARENPVMLSDDEDSMTYFSARSEPTIASDNDTLSFKSAPDTPTNTDEFQFPIKDDSILDYDIITTPIGSDDEKLVPDVNTTPITAGATPITARTTPRGASSMDGRSLTPALNQTPKYQIKIIDESGKQGPKVLSASMENVSSPVRGKLNSNLSSSTPQFGELQTSQSRFGGSGSFFGKETSI